MDLLEKLQIPAGKSIFVSKAPKTFDFRVKLSKKTEEAVAILVFASDSRALKEEAGPAIQAAKEDKLSWIAYPKSKKMGTDLNRDKLVELMRPFGIDSVRLVSIDDCWSAIRFRPAKRRTAVLD
jgi:hypothetical protein